MQSRRMSLIESGANILVGFGISLISQIIIFEAHGVYFGIGTNAAITGYFTVISFIRSYALRRVFNKIRH